MDSRDPPLSADFQLDDTVKIGGAGNATNPNTRDLVQIENASLG